MLAKIGNLIINENKINSYKKLSSILLLCGIFIFIALPLFSNRIFITEKQLKSSDSVYSQFKFEFFRKEMREILLNKKIINKKDSIKSSKLESIHIISPRGERNKFIMINCIYDSSWTENYLLSHLAPLYTFISHLSNLDNITWLTKDIQFNFISKEEFYSNPEKLLIKLISDENQKTREGQMIEGVINLDFSKINFDSEKYLLFKITGMNSENIDMDYYKTFFDNLLISNFQEEKIRTVDFYFSSYIKFYLKNILYNIGSMIQGLIPKDKNNLIRYEHDFVYFLENIFENYILTNEKINFNHLIISKGINSVLIKETNSHENGEFFDNSQKEEYFSINEANVNSYTNSNKMRLAFNFFSVMERVIKNFSKNEIETFRGDYNHIMTNSHSFVGIGFFILIPALCVLRIFYEILDKIYSSKNEEVLMSKIAAYSMILFLIQIMLFLHIKEIQNYLQFTLISTFYHILGLNFIFCFVVFRLMDLNKNEEIFFDNLIRFMLALNCFNIFFINYGIGLLLTVVLMPLEVILNYIQDKLNRIFLQIFCLVFIMYCILMDKFIVESIIENFMNHFNNIYPIFSFIFIYLLFRINLVIRRWLNLQHRVTIKSLDIKTE
jgi:hypothetical protein